MSDIFARILPHRLAEDMTGAVRDLLDVLRSGKPLSPELAAVLADMIDPAGTGRWKLELSGRGRKGPSPKPLSADDVEIADFALDIIEKGGKYENALDETFRRFGCGRTKIARVLARRREEIKLIADIEENTDEMVSRVFRG